MITKTFKLLKYYHLLLLSVITSTGFFDMQDLYALALKLHYERCKLIRIN